MNHQKIVYAESLFIYSVTNAWACGGRLRWRLENKKFGFVYFVALATQNIEPESRPNNFGGQPAR
ncbi:hypothetical protein SAMN05444166_3350 [Singulisphaera sp. GP187]|nr:hypothetical protein SAMN05444166_3350 [Singulisphaera sp. GP187]